MDAILPGEHDIGGLWPAFWILGNLGRATYEASTNLMCVVRKNEVVMLRFVTVRVSHGTDALEPVLLHVQNLRCQPCIIYGIGINGTRRTVSHLEDKAFNDARRLPHEPVVISFAQVSLYALAIIRLRVPLL